MIERFLASATRKGCWGWCECNAHKHRCMVVPCTDTDLSTSMQTCNQALPSVNYSKIKNVVGEPSFLISIHRVPNQFSSLASSEIKLQVHTFFSRFIFMKWNQVILCVADTDYVLSFTIMRCLWQEILASSFRRNWDSFLQESKEGKDSLKCPSICGS